MYVQLTCSKYRHCEKYQHYFGSHLHYVHLIAVEVYVSQTLQGKPQEGKAIRVLALQGCWKTGTRQEWNATGSAVSRTQKRSVYLKVAG